MLVSLRIENYAIVSHLELDFTEGMTAFTGETGAGKSIMIDALMLALGERTDATVIRTGAEKCDITACFQLDSAEALLDWLKEHDVSHDEGELFLRRVIYREGRSKSYINGQPFPLQKIKELGEMLVCLHGQHQHQTLLQHVTHRQQLDQYANHTSLLHEVADIYHQCLETKLELQRLENQDSTAERLVFLEHQLEELLQLDPREGEMQALHEEHQLLHHAKDYLQHTQQMTELLCADDEPNICQGLNRILQMLASLPQENTLIKSSSLLINNALIQCEEAKDDIATFANAIQLDPERLQVVEERISQLHQAARKYHVEVNLLPTLAALLQEEIQQIQNQGQALKKLQQQYEVQCEAYMSLAMRLRASRQTHAPKLAEEITATIQQLGMPKGYLMMDITPLDKMQVHGLDRVEYKVCTNPGMPLDLLPKVVSGGELSRIGLAIHVITAKRGATPTLLFDEVDVGIGGPTAALVGQLLRQLGERLQIFCVTHQPQVASQAHHHFKVEKRSDDAQTFSQVIPLSHPEKINEIARMLGGLTITEQSLSHAEELLQN